MIRCLKISGRVQGVGFRFWAKRMINVLVLISGDEIKLNEVQKSLYKGPLFARVDKITETPELIGFFPPIENGVFKRL